LCERKKIKQQTEEEGRRWVAIAQKNQEQRAKEKKQVATMLKKKKRKGISIRIVIRGITRGASGKRNSAAKQKEGKIRGGKKATTNRKKK